MASYDLLPPPQPMSLNGDLAENWKYFEEAWKNYATATELIRKSKAVQVASLLTGIGREIHTIYANLDLSEEDKKIQAQYWKD